MTAVVQVVKDLCEGFRWPAGYTYVVFGNAACSDDVQVVIRCRASDDYRLVCFSVGVLQATPFLKLLAPFAETIESVLADLRDARKMRLIAAGSAWGIARSRGVA